VDYDSSTGDLSLQACEAGQLRVNTSTGDLLLEGGEHGRVTFSSSTGDLTQRNVRIGSLEQD
jgi:hypothetical protein